MKHASGSRILVVEDETHIAEGLRLNLSLQGHAVRIARDGSAALHSWRQWHPQLIVLDLMLPGIDGLSLLQRIRLEDERVPVLILSAKGTSDDKVRGFACGTDDYLAKPFDLDEFLKRVERLLTRSAWSQPTDTGQGVGDSVPSPYRFGANEIDFGTGTARCQLGTLTLTEQELRLLKLFVSKRGQPLSRQALLSIGWGYCSGTATRTVDSFMVRLRRYFEPDPRRPLYFRSLRAVGYVFDHPD
jgi:DNA-binding response OmpR family regulator